VEHGGIEEFGPPITHYGPLFGTAYHQVFYQIVFGFNPPT